MCFSAELMQTHVSYYENPMEMHSGAATEAMDAKLMSTLNWSIITLNASGKLNV